MPSTVGRDLQVSDVPLRGGSRRHWNGFDRSARGLDAYQKPHPYPVSGGAAPTAFDVGSKRCRTGRRGAHRLPVSFPRLQRTVGLD